MDSFCKLEVAGSGTFEQVLPPLVEVKVNPAPVTAFGRFAAVALEVFRFMAVLFLP